MNAKFTQKVEQYLATAAELAQESSHQQLSPVHLAIAMFEDPEGIGKQSAVKAGGTAEAVAARARCMLKLLVVYSTWSSIATAAGAKLFVLVLGCLPLSHGLLAPAVLQRRTGVGPGPCLFWISHKIIITWPQLPQLALSLSAGLPGWHKQPGMNEALTSLAGDAECAALLACAAACA